MIETILRTFPDYIKVKDLPHDDTAYKVNHFHLFSAVFSYSVLKCGCFQFQSESFFILSLYPVLLILFLQIDMVTLLYEKGILVRKWKIFCRDSGSPLRFHSVLRTWLRTKTRTRSDLCLTTSQLREDWEERDKGGLTPLTPPSPKEKCYLFSSFYFALRSKLSMVINSR